MDALADFTDHLMIVLVCNCREQNRHDDKGAKITKASFIGHINPLRYRGYYYDRETRLYYLQSRGTTTSQTAGSSTRMGCLQTVLLEQIYLHTV